MEAINLLDEVKVQLIHESKICDVQGTIIGRTIQENPKYDVVLKNQNVLLNISEKRITKI
tara:strand:+ start:742 stop:921 length:180 start_codon:yes stop_codon:yes gene_type:complete